MTCIVGIVGNNEVWMGGDSASISGWVMNAARQPKVFQRAECLIGFTDSFRMGDLLRYRLEVPVRPEEQDTHEWAATSFADALRNCLSNGGYAKKENEREEGGTFLLGCGGRLFCIYSDYHISEPLCGYDACGSGREVALGALYVTRGQVPEKRIVDALEGAAQHIACVEPPFTIMKLRGVE